jgi:hypothetical protein
MGLYPLRAGGIAVQTDVPGQANSLKDIVEQHWAAPVATDDNKILEVETIPALGKVFTASDGLGGVAQTLKVTVGGVAGDIKAVNIAIAGTDSLDQPLSENFLLTVNTAGVVQGVSLFKTVTSITSPAQDGPGVTMKVGTATDDDAVLPVETIPAAGLVYAIGAIDGQPDVSRGLFITVAGTAGDTTAGNIAVDGTDIKGEALSENFLTTLNTNTVIQGLNAFKTVRRIAVPAQDGGGVTVMVGVNDLLGLNTKLSLDTVAFASLGGTKEGTAPAVTTSATILALNTVDLFSALNGTAVKIGYII